jgi:hypothetical protein
MNIVLLKISEITLETFWGKKVKKRRIICLRIKIIDGRE